MWNWQIHIPVRRKTNPFCLLSSMLVSLDNVIVPNKNENLGVLVLTLSYPWDSNTTANKSRIKDQGTQPLISNASCVPLAGLPPHSYRILLKWFQYYVWFLIKYLNLTYFTAIWNMVYEKYWLEYCMINYGMLLVWIYCKKYFLRCLAWTTDV